MNILFLTQLFPYPPHTGGRFKTFSILKLLIKNHPVHLVTFRDQKNINHQLQSLKKYSNLSIKTFYFPQTTAPSKKIKSIAFKSLFSLKPFRVYKYFNPQAAQYLASLTLEKTFDLIYLDHNTSFQYLDFIHQKPKTKIYYDEHNINSLATWRSFKEIRRHPLVRLFNLIDVGKNFFYEKKIVKSVSHIFAISPVDKKLLIKRGAKRDSITTLPIPLTAKNLYRFQKNRPNILFVGLMSWGPNKLGLSWFINKVYPQIKLKIPQVTLTIVGPKPDQKIIKLQQSDSSIKIIGEVPSLAPYYQKASLLAAPIFSGSGIRIKILHSLAHGLPVISTSIGAEGIPKKGIIIADQPRQFIDQTIKLLTRPTLTYQLSQQGLKLIKINFSSSQTLQILENKLHHKS